MNNKQYPTRMHEVLGVEPEERFTHGDYGSREFCLSESGLLCRIFDDGTFIPTTSGYDVVYMINHPERITRRPRLTEEQVKQLRALVTLGFNWLCQDSNDFSTVYVNKPTKGEFSWKQGGHYVLIEYGIPAEILTSLVSWSDPSPLDIVATLKAAGVEGKG